MNPQSSYVDALLTAFRSLPGTSGRTGPADRSLARSLHADGVELSLVRSALLLGTVRRLARASSPLPPVRSLAYFLPLVDEIRKAPLDPSYQAYLERTLLRLMAASGQKTAVSSGR